MTALPPILAIDLATRTGWAVRKDGVVTSGFVDLGGDGGMLPVAKAERLMRWMRSTIDASAIKIVVYEAPIKRHASAGAAELAYGLAMACQLMARSKNCEVSMVHVGTIKKAWTGKGNAKKPDMVEMARANGFDVRDHNEADALALIHYAASQMGGGVMPGRLL